MTKEQLIENYKENHTKEINQYKFLGLSDDQILDCIVWKLENDLSRINMMLKCKLKERGSDLNHKEVPIKIVGLRCSYSSDE